MTDANLTLKQLLQQQKQHLVPEHLFQNLAFDLRQWLCEVLQKNYSFIIAHDDYEPTQDQLKRYQAGVEKLLAGVPLAYVKGYQPFYGLDFKVNEHTLIPRADTQVLLDTAIMYYQQNFKQKPNPDPIRVLDLGTGSGCVAISVAHYLQSLNQVYHVMAVDISTQALAIAQQNSVDNQVRVTFLQGSWFAALEQSPATDLPQLFDIILSNPPYIDPQDPHLAALTDEPITALVADNQGLADIFHIIEHAKPHLKSGGLLALEHGYDQGDRVRAHFSKNGFSQVITHKDLGVNDRVTQGIYLP